MPTVLVKALTPNEKDQSFAVNSEGLIYDELENQGCILPHGCLAGSCGSCRIEMISGAENLSVPSRVEQNTIDALSSSHPNKVIRLACRARVLGDIEIAVLTRSN